MEQKRDKTKIKYLAISIIFSLLMPILVPVISIATANAEYEYTVEGDSVIINRYLLNAELVIVPETIDGKTVTTIGSNAFSNNISLTRVILPSTITRIQSSAFEACFSLQTIEFPTSIQSIEDRAFARCSSLEQIHIPNGLTTIEMGKSIFEGCIKLKDVTLPETITTIREKTFSACINLKNITLPDNITTIETGAFDGCLGLISISMPKTVTNIQNNAFANCINLQSVVIPDRASIGDNAFIGCEKLSTVMIPAGVTTIGANVFENSPNVVIYSELDSVAHQYAKDNQIAYVLYNEEYDYRITDENTILLKKYRGTQEQVTIPTQIAGRRIQRIQTQAFQGHSNLKNVYIPSSIEEIEEEVFKDCPEVVINCEVNTKAYQYARENKISYVVYNQEYEYTINEQEEILLKKYKGTQEQIQIPTQIEGKRVITIGENAFAQRENLTNVWIPSSIENMENNVFENSPNVVINCEINTKAYQYARDNAIKLIVYNNDYEYTINLDETLTIRDYKGSETTVIVPEQIEGRKVTIIGERAFEANTSIQSVTIPNMVTEIHRHAFLSCTNLTQVILPKGLTKIEVGTFKGCTNLTDVILPTTTQTIGTEAFRGCSNLTFLEIGKTVTLIEEEAFLECPNLVVKCEVGSVSYQYAKDHSIEMIAYDENYEYRIVEEKVTLNYYKGNQKEVVIPETIEEKPVSKIAKEAFKGNTNITKITLSNRLEQIEENAFSGCINLGIVSIPANVSYIASNAFTNSSNVVIRCQINTVAYQYARDNQLPFVIYSNEFDYEITFDEKENVILTKYTGTDEEVVIPETIVGRKVIQIGKDSFKSNNTIRKVDLRNTQIQEIGMTAFANSNNLQEILLSETLVEIGTGAFERCTSLTNVTIPNSVISMKDGAFANCTNLKSVSLSEKLTIIENDVFFGCTKLEKVQIPKGVTDIKERAFKRATNLTQITLPETLLKIADEALAECKSLREIQLPNSVVNIEGMPFKNSPNVVIYCQIDTAAYQHARNKGITCIIYDQNYEYMVNEDETLTITNFKNTNTTLTIPAKIGQLKVKNIPSTFLETLIHIEVEEENEYYASEKGVLYNKDKTVLIKYPSHKAETEYVIPQGVKKIATNAFLDCEKLANIDIPKTVGNLNKTTFENSNNITVNYEISLNTTPEQVKQQQLVTGEYSIVKQDNSQLDSVEKIGTGMRIQFSNNTQYNIIVKGDLNGDGKIGVVDLTKMKRNLVGIEILETIYKKAADITNKGNISVVDLVKIKKVIVGLEKIQ